jgi:hypothetical protein
MKLLYMPGGGNPLSGPKAIVLGASSGVGLWAAIYLILKVIW